MSTKLNYTTEQILNIKFGAKEKGYDPLQVDQVFDKMIEDYNNLDKQVKKASEDNDKLNAEIYSLKETIEKLRITILKLRQQLENVPKSSGLNQDNYKLMKKITAYEKVLFRKGIDLEKALSDPDNC